MKKFMAIFLSLSFLLTACSDDNVETNDNTNVETENDEDTSSNTLQTTNIEGKLTAIQNYAAMKDKSLEEIEEFVLNVVEMDYDSEMLDTEGYAYLLTDVNSSDRLSEEGDFYRSASTYGYFEHSEQVSDDVTVFFSIMNGASEYGTISVFILDDNTDASIKYYYFPEDGRISMLTELADVITYEDLNDDEKELYDTYIEQSLEVFESSLDEIESYFN